ncbi:hypothetical protein [Campylobacter sp. RM16192]|nr:hypothetical protein [Campylobacter sp. RM16192]
MGFSQKMAIKKYNEKHNFQYKKTKSAVKWAFAELRKKRFKVGLIDFG